MLSRKTIKGPDGGVAMFISNTLKWQRRYDLERDDLESIWTEIFPHNAKMSFYLPSIDPLMDRNIFLKVSILNDTLSVISSQRIECIIMGDTSINCLDKNNHNGIKDIFMLYG